MKRLYCCALSEIQFGSILLGPVPRTVSGTLAEGKQKRKKEGKAGQDVCRFFGWMGLVGVVDTDCGWAAGRSCPESRPAKIGCQLGLELLLAAWLAWICCMCTLAALSDSSSS